MAEGASDQSCPSSERSRHSLQTCRVLYVSSRVSSFFGSRKLSTYPAKLHDFPPTLCTTVTPALTGDLADPFSFPDRPAPVFLANDQQRAKHLELDFSRQLGDALARVRLTLWVRRGLDPVG